MVELQHQVVTVRTAATPFEQFNDLRPSDHVASREVLGGRRIAFHEALAVLVDEVTAFTAAALGHQDARAGDARWVELPHLDILHR